MSQLVAALATLTLSETASANAASELEAVRANAGAGYYAGKGKDLATDLRACGVTHTDEDVEELFAACERGEFDVDQASIAEAKRVREEGEPIDAEFDGDDTAPATLNAPVPPNPLGGGSPTSARFPPKPPVDNP